MFYPTPTPGCDCATCKRLRAATPRRDSLRARLVLEKAIDLGPPQPITPTSFPETK